MSKRVNLTLSDEQYNMWKEMAEQRGMTFPEFIRQAVRVYITMLQKVAKRA